MSIGARSLRFYGLVLLAASSAVAQPVYNLRDLTAMCDLGDWAHDATLVGGLNESGQVAFMVMPPPETGGYGAKVFVWDGQSVRDIDSFGDLGSRLSAYPNTRHVINSTGQVAGACDFSAPVGTDPTYRAFKWDGAAIQDLGCIPADSRVVCEAVGINDAGDVAGWSWPVPDFPTWPFDYHALIWSDGTVTDLGIGELTDIANNGWATGWGAAQSGEASWQAFVWDGNTRHFLFAPINGTSSWAWSVNSSGHATGWYNDGTNSAFLWDGVTVRLFNPSADTYSVGYSVNEHGWVTGACSSGVLLWNGTASVSVGGGEGWAINDLEHVTGFMGDRPFLWDGSHQHDLNNLVASADPLLGNGLTGIGRAINDSDQIALERWDDGHVYLASPVTQAIGTGSSVTAAPLPATDTDPGSLLVTFGSVSTPGVVTAARVPSDDPAVPPPPGAFDFAGDIFQIQTTAQYSGDAEVCMDWNDPNVEPTMLHLVGGSWQQLTTSRTGPGFHCAWTSSFSPFALVVPVEFNFAGFFPPVDNPPVMNSVKAGRAIPVKFSLGGYRGMDIFAQASPASRRVDCSSALPVDAVEETVTSGGSELSYDPQTDRYTYVWKTDSSWTGTCRQLVLDLVDGSRHVANFKLTR